MEKTTIRIFAEAFPNDSLKDTRYTHARMDIGTLTMLARQYGVQLTVVETGTVCIAPQKRMQIFVERLHFAGVKYQEV